MQIVVKMKVIMSPPGRILKERPLTASERLQSAHPKAERELLQIRAAVSYGRAAIALIRSPRRRGRGGSEGRQGRGRGRS